MSQFWLYFKLGLEHVLDWQAYDHILFIVALCAAYSWNRWKQLLLLVSMFTLGHTLSLFITHYGVLDVPPTWVEFLIPVTIMVAAIYNIVKVNTLQENEKSGWLSMVTLFFGGVHGFGFGRYFNQINDEKEVMPLIDFALGIELSQVIIVLAVLIVGYFVKTFLKFQQRDWILVISSVVIGMAFPMLIENWPF
ncbi:MAG: HupE / UreJ protein [Alteromonas sp.]|nr:HupE / UreJ protein [Alteromonas sp.]MAY21859.1 HupE / UreJ protein [Flavobacteriaceae bacterium]|tara:strand:+ start:35819 stop:36397 length:579 start_codon:yes stop_codon:yes gene_type:complete